MMEVNKQLTIISYNCQHADNVRLPILQELFEKCDFLLLQEHSLFQSKLSWFNNIGNNIGIHGVSAMDENKPLRGRPNGGAAILWHESINGRNSPVPWDNKRFCAITYDTGKSKILIICVYMPCDNWRPDCNVLVYNDILNEICMLSTSVGAEFICIGGDFNTDLKRSTYQTNSLKSFFKR